MTALPRVQYFLGANAPNGFYSLYSELIPPEDARAVYILKGGPGCGKSTLMRRVGEAMEQAGLETEYILCSGDPDSLDGLVLPQLGAALVDGTAPHALEPKLPGAVDHYVNLEDCYDRAALFPLRGPLRECMTGYRECYQRAYRCLGASAELADDLRAVLVTQVLTERLAKRARGILSREIPRQKGSRPGRVKQRFLGAITHRGKLCLFDSALAQCDRVYELADRYGLAHELLVPLLTGITAEGFDVVACPDPMAPDRLAHLLVPQLRLAFLTSTPALPFPGEPYRRIRLDGTVDPALLRDNRSRFRFTQKVSHALVGEAIASLSQAKAMHDDLEQLYNPHVDFGRVEQVSAELIEELLSFRA